eukprot:CAMPEP_0114590332 /NCGR_PEP_ID=MMETSP0125-20121206/12598_1 /TAXON_ID=485358 ORGANISM="Aristerostoma sp., Strain ATCC 50986" /NCGR_SAMPLE_ID=MMETSP0125 /ASSEMBLY_ACC=CAM_ASM_000245 /LENGTH=513 /DNA_ID=CAMNT_0001787749 /DNA_START=4155 /DNA_END=5696 /DNA_ORIENTATION=-
MDDGRCVGGCGNECIAGYTGALCESCDFNGGYVEGGYMKCGKCKDEQTSLTISAIASFGFFFYNMMCIYGLFIGNEHFIKDRNTVQSTIEIEKGFYIRLVITFTQIFSLVYTLDITFESYLSFFTQIGNPTTLIIYGLQCSLRALGIKPDDFLYVTTLVTVLSPLIQFVCVAILAGIVKLITKNKKYARFMILSAIYIIIVLQPGIVAHLASMLACAEMYPGSGTFITLHPNWSCDTDMYDNYIWVLVLPNLLIWSLIIPVLFFYLLFRNRKKLNNEKQRITLGVLYNDLKDKYYYWGIVIMVVKLIVSFLAYTLQNHLKTRIFSLFFVLWGYQSLVKFIKPYRYKEFNKVEHLTFSLFMIDILLAYYYLENPYESAQIFTILVLAVLNASFGIFVAWKMLKVSIMRFFIFVDKFLSKRGGGQDDESEGVRSKRSTYASKLLSRHSNYLDEEICKNDNECHVGRRTTVVEPLFGNKDKADESGAINISDDINDSFSVIDRRYAKEHEEGNKQE